MEQALRLEMMDPATLKDNPLQWRTHPTAQAEALRGVLEEVGWAGAALLNERTGFLVDGHLRRDVALQRGDVLMPVLVGSWEEGQERLILATLDPLSALARTSKDALDALLREVETGEAAAQELLASIAEGAGLYGVSAYGPKLDDVEFPEYDESAEDEVAWIECPECGHKWPA